MSAKFYPLKVIDIQKTTQDSVVVSFDVPSEHKDIFSFTQGQYLTLKSEINGESVRRSYSLCSSVDDNEWKVAIKEVAGGKYSTYANHHLSEGDIIECMPPDGRFFVNIDASQQRNYVAFAAGSGITPILSIIKTHLSKEPSSRFTLFYTNKNAKSIMLKEELEALKNLYMNRFQVFYFLTQEQRNIPLFNGRIDHEKLKIIFKTIVNQERIDHYFLCGPEEMIFLVRDYLLSIGIEKNKLHFELFTSSSEEKQQIIKDTKKKYEGLVSDITVIEGGKTLKFEIPQGSDNILDAALSHSSDLPFACKGGVCCTCKAKLLEGDVNLLVNYGLEEEELEKGYILCCQAIPISDKVIVDFDS